MSIKIEEAVKIEDFNSIEALARVVWLEHYTPIIGRNQVEYMLDKFQTSSVMHNQCLKEKYKYYKAIYNDELIGYCSTKLEDNNSIFLSKIYIHKDYRNRGFAKEMIKFFITEYKKNSIKSIRLNVNKSNKNSIDAYKKIGFKIKNSIVTDIGNGYQMDDYDMELLL